MRRIRTTRHAIIVLAGLALAGCGSATAPTSTGTSAAGGSSSGQAQTSGLGTPATTIKETDTLTFAPTSAAVHPGDVVQFTDGGAVPHNVTFDAEQALSSATMQQNDTWQVRFTTPGTYQFHCTFHPGMNGTITVTA